MDGNIYYIDMIFLTWISKHKKGDLPAAYDSFLFMEGLFMDPIIILLSIHGENIDFSFIDFLKHYLHTLTISIQCIAPQEGKLFIELHGQHWAKLYDGDNHILYGLGQLFSFMYV